MAITINTRYVLGIISDILNNNCLTDYDYCIKL